MMDAESVDLTLEVLSKASFQSLDITGGAPELNPHFRRLAAGTRALGLQVIDLDDFRGSLVEPIAD